MIMIVSMCMDSPDIPPKKVPGPSFHQLGSSVTAILPLYIRTLGIAV